MDLTVSHWCPPAVDGEVNATAITPATPHAKRATGENPLPPLPAEPLEQAIIQEVEQLINQPSLLMQVFQHSQETEDEITYEQTVEALNTLKTIWQELFPNEQQRIAQLLIDRIDVQENNLRIRFHTGGVPEITEDLQGAA